MNYINIHHLVQLYDETGIAPKIFSTPIGTTYVATTIATSNKHSDVDPRTVNVTDFHRGAVIYLACESNIRSFYNIIFVQGDP